MGNSFVLGDFSLSQNVAGEVSSLPCTYGQIKNAGTLLPLALCTDPIPSVLTTGKKEAPDLWALPMTTYVALIQLVS